MYLEFAGLPGSGKSTLSSALKKYITEFPCHVLSREEAIIQCIKRRDDGFVKNMLKHLPSRLWRQKMGVQYGLQEFIKLSTLHLEFITFVSKMVSESKLPELLKESIWNTIVRTFVEIELVSKHMNDSQLVIMDEAFLQRCFTLFGYMEKTITDDLLLTYADLAPIPEHVFLIITDPETCVERFMLRYQSKPVLYNFELNKDELVQEFTSGNSILKRVSEILENQGKNVHRIDGNSTLDESVKALCLAASVICSEKFHESRD